MVEVVRRHRRRQEFALDANRLIEPFDQSRLPKVVQQMLDTPDGDQRIRIALPELYARYEQLRRDEHQDDPPIVALRLYELGWIIRPDAANVDAPERRRLIAE
jgi:hypothetical protein